MTVDPHIISTEGAAAAIGPYSQAVEHDGILYCSGALPLDPDMGRLVREDAATQTTQCLTNLAAVCRTAGTTLSRSLRLTIYTTQLARFAEINHAYAEALGDARPARTTVAVAGLPRDALVEIDVIVAVR